MITVGYISAARPTTIQATCSHCGRPTYASSNDTSPCCWECGERVRQRAANEQVQAVMNECPIKRGMVVVRRAKASNNPQGKVIARRIGQKKNRKTGKYELCVICRVEWEGLTTGYARLGGSDKMTSDVQADSLSPVEIK